MAFLAPALDALRDEIDAKYPARERISDGWIGDARHSASVSDHNPDSTGMVHAIDVTASGIPAEAIIDFLVGRHKSGTENRAWYFIFKRRIWSRTYGYAEKPYTGSNPHDKHFHVSLRYVDSIEGNRASWLGLFQKEDDRYTTWYNGTAGSRIVALWDSGVDVKKLQFILNAWYTNLNVTEDGYFGPGTSEAVKYFQSRAGLTADGIVGPKSWNALNVI